MYIKADIAKDEAPPIKLLPQTLTHKSRISSKVFTIPKPDFLKNKPQPKAIKKVPLRLDAYMEKPMEKQNIRYNKKLNQKPVVKEEYSNYRRRASSILMRPPSRIPRRARQSMDNIAHLSKADQRQRPTVDSPVKVLSPVLQPPSRINNNVRFFENQHSLSSDEEEKQNHTFKPQLIKVEANLATGNLEAITKESLAEDPGIHINPKTSELEDASTTFEEPSKSQIEISKVIEMPETKSILPKYLNTLDYFRFTKTKVIEEADARKETDNSRLSEIKEEITPTKQPEEPIFEEIQLELQKPQPQPLQQPTFSEPHCLTERTQKKETPSQQIARPTTQHPYKRIKVKARYIQFAIRELPVPSISYHEMIPTFNSLFHPEAEVLSSMKLLISIITQHLSINKRQIQQQPTGQLDDRDQLIDRHKHLVNIDLWKEKDRRRWGTNEELMTNRLFYRVVKTKQEVYELITSSLRKVDWLELPHGLNLKHSWNLLWTWSKPQIDFHSLIYFQKVNHFPLNKNLSRKDMLKKNIEKIKRLGNRMSSLFDIIPETYLLPGESDQFIEKYHQYSKERLNIWIMKPVGQSRGRGIRLISHPSEVEYNEPVVMQRYLKDPLLLDGTKFDLRIYVLVTSFNPLEAYLYKEGFARMSTQKYTLDDLDNHFVHLTNYAIQKENLKQDYRTSVGGSKISLKMLRKELEKRGISWEDIWGQIIEVILKSLIACMNEIPQNRNCFELFGYDIILDSNLKCWLLEVNSSPSFEKEFPLDELIKQQLTNDIIFLLDLTSFDRVRLKEVLQRRVMETEGRKSYLNTNNNSTSQLNQDLFHILHGKPLRKYGQSVASPNWVSLAPSQGYFRLVKTLQTYKKTSIIKQA